MVCYPPTRLLRGVSGTDIAYGAIRLSACYAVSSTEIACGARGVRAGQGSSSLLWCAICLRACYAVSGTDVVYGALSAYALATRCPVLT
eukprot:2623263-Rhodomonas_salina.1